MCLIEVSVPDKHICECYAFKHISNESMMIVDQGLHLSVSTEVLLLTFGPHWKGGF